MFDYRPIAGPMCGNCNNAYIGYEDEGSCELESGKDSLKERLIFNSFGWCSSHDPMNSYLDYFEKNHNGVLPVVVMMPKNKLYWGKNNNNYGC